MMGHSADINHKDPQMCTPLITAVRAGAPNRVKQLLKYTRIKIDEASVEGKSALHWAVELNQMDIVTALLTKQCAVNLRDNEGETPLHYAARLGFSDCISRLLAAGSDKTLKNKKGLTPLQILQIIKEEADLNEEQQACIAYLKSGGAVEEKEEGGPIKERSINPKPLAFLSAGPTQSDLEMGYHDALHALFWARTDPEGTSITD